MGRRETGKIVSNYIRMTNLGRNLSIACRYAVVISIWKKLEEIYQWLVCRYAVGISICWNRTVISRQS